MKPVTDKLIRFFASVEWSLLLLRLSLLVLLVFVADNWGVLNPGSTLLSPESSSVGFERIRPEFPLHLPSGFWLVLLAIVLLLILVHVCVVILIRNSGGRHATLSTLQGLLGLWMLTAFIMTLGHRQYEVDAEPGATMRFLSLPETYELAIIDHSDPEKEGVYVVNWNDLRTGKILRHQDWDFHLRVNVRYPHAVFANILARKVDSGGKQIFGIVANRGFAMEQELKMFSTEGHDLEYEPGMLLEVFDYDGDSIGTYILGTESSGSIPPQEIQIDDQSYTLVLRHRQVDPGFQWRLLSTSDKQNPTLQILRPGREPLEKAIGWFQAPKYRGYRFHLFPDPSESPVDFSAVHISIVRNPWGTPFAIITLLTLLAALVHCIIHLRMLSKEVDQ